MFKGRENIINTVLGGILILIIIANVVKVINYRAGDRFEWSSGVFTKPDNTVQVAKCTFFYMEHWNYAINEDQILNNGRENINYTEKGLEKAFYPDSLSILWYSYIQQKFYQGNFSLPYKVINDLARKLRKNTKAYEMSYARTNANEIKLYFLAELQPNGKVTVWLSDLDKYIEIGKYQAKEVSKTWEIFDSIYSNGENKKKVSIATQTALVMEEHPYLIETQLPELLSIRKLSIEPYNQVKWELNKDKPQSLPIFKNIPKNINITWGNDQKEYWIQYYFKDEDILSAFKKLQSLPGNNETVLIIKVSDKNDTVSMSLKKGSTVIYLPYAYDHLEIYDRVPEKEDD